jgi:glycosyltransferase involved in cell wall biosynthesis
MNPPALVSVVINNYNYGRFLGSAIDSALGQTYPHVEVIVVDDGSTDDSSEVIARYGDRIVAIHQSNSGQGAAVNAGFARSVGSITIFLDADDALLPDLAGKVAATFRDAPDLARVQYRLQVIDAVGAPTGEWIPAAYAPMPSGDLRRNLAKFNNYAWWPPMSGHAFNANVLRRIMPMPEAPFRWSADHYLVRTSTLCGPIRSLDEICASYRVHGANRYLRAGLDLAVLRRHVAITNDTHHLLQQFAATIRFDEYPAHASDAWDLPFYASRMTLLRLDPALNPVAGDRLLPLAWRGAAVALRQTQRSVAFRLLAAAWFAAMLVAPPSLTWSLAEWFFYPHTRPRALRASARSRVAS